MGPGGVNFIVPCQQVDIDSDSASSRGEDAAGGGSAQQVSKKKDCLPVAEIVIRFRQGCNPWRGSHGDQLDGKFIQWIPMVLKNPKATV
jgi:hypothetical protein